MVQQSEIIYDMNIADEIDATGLLCPLPVLKLKKRIKSINKGQVIKIFTDDPAAELDIPHFCTETNHKILNKIQEKDPSGFTFYVMKC
tara:strand:- start:955 stop:1218 length:264 start_codon:yes stop_codon:yes gene_type:complete